MEFEESKYMNLNDITHRRASGSLTQTSYTSGSITSWSDTSSESSDVVVQLEKLLIGNRSKSHSDCRNWPSKRAVIVKSKFMALPRNSKTKFSESPF